MLFEDTLLWTCARGLYAWSEIRIQCLFGYWARVGINALGPSTRTTTRAVGGTEASGSLLLSVLLLPEASKPSLRLGERYHLLLSVFQDLAVVRGKDRGEIPGARSISPGKSF